LVVALVAIVISLCIAAGLFFRADFKAKQELDAAIAETDQLDSNWRLEDIEAGRKVIPDDQNAALVVMQVRALLTSPWRTPLVSDHEGNPPRYLEERLADVALERQFGIGLTSELRAELDKVKPAVLKARTLANFRDGRFPITYSKDLLSTLVKCEDPREIARLLELDAKLLAQDDKADEALNSGLAIVVASRSIGDEPMLISQRVRTACRAVALYSIHRTLSQGHRCARRTGVPGRAISTARDGRTETTGDRY
jgi:hypothetical protein